MLAGAVTACQGVVPFRLSTHNDGVSRIARHRYFARAELSS